MTAELNSNDGSAASELPQLDPESVFESARFVASVSLTLGALMLSLFGLVERLVTFERLAIEREFSLLALLPGIATLSFLACARAVSWMISNMRSRLWRNVVPPQRWKVLEDRVENSNQFRFRLTLMSGAYGLFTLVITAMAATSAGLAFGLASPEYHVASLPMGLAAAAVTTVLVLNEMLTRDRPAKTAATAIFVGVLIATLVMDVLL
jgi:hypothetical protein